jgi:CheY-like chemotaxis protein/anti-sigma regulatory factor (Ser/Thr protein kinase)
MRHDRDPRLVGRKVLVVDDTPSNIDLLLTILEPQGFNVLVATSGETALRVAHKAEPDVILLDVMMPGIDGFETCRRLKADPRFQETPVIFVTARDDTDDVVTAFDLGAVDYIAKPYRHEEVLVRVRTHVLIKALTDELHEKAAEAETLLHILCHDLQNSIGAAQGYLSLIDGADLAGGSVAYVADTRATVDRAMLIIDHVRELRALMSGKRTLALRPVTLRDCFGAVASVFHLRLAEKRIALKYPRDASADLAVTVDEISFVSGVLSNIVSNAIKFSHPKSTIAFTVADLGDTVRISLRDDGIGMSPVLLGNLFRTDQPTSRPGTAGELGTGFGMPLVKRYVELFGGTVAVESSDGEDGRTPGTTVHLVLPKARAAAAAA